MVNDDFVQFLEKCLNTANEGIKDALHRNHIGLHIMFKCQKNLTEQILEEYYKTHVKESEKSGAV